MAYAIKDAVKETLDVIPKGKDFKGVVFIQDCRRKLKEHGYCRHPYDDTFLRELRQQRNNYKIVCVDYGKSIYRMEE